MVSRSKPGAPQTVSALHLPKWGQGLGGSWPGPCGSHKDAQVVSTPPGSSSISKHFTHLAPVPHRHGPALAPSSLSQTTATCLFCPIPPPSPHCPLPCRAACVHLLLKALLWLPTACNLESTPLSPLWPSPHPQLRQLPSGAPFCPCSPCRSQLALPSPLAGSPGPQAPPSA